MSRFGEYLESRFDGGSDDKVRYDLAGAATGAGLGLLSADAIEATQQSRERRNALRQVPALEEEAERAKNVAQDAANHKEWSLANSVDDLGGDKQKYQLGQMYKQLQAQLEHNDSPELRAQLSDLVRHMKDEGVTTYDGPLLSNLRELTPGQQQDLDVLRAGYGLFEDKPVKDIAEETFRNANLAETKVHSAKNMVKPGLADYLPSPSKMKSRGVVGAMPYALIGGALGLGGASYIQDYNAFKEDQMNKEAHELQEELEKIALSLGGLSKVAPKPFKVKKPPVPKAGETASSTAAQAVDKSTESVPAPAAPATPNAGPSLGKRMKRGALLLGAGGVGGYALNAGQAAYQQGAAEQQAAQQKLASEGGNQVEHSELEKIANQYMNGMGFRTREGREVERDNAALRQEAEIGGNHGDRRAIRNLDEGYDRTAPGVLKDAIGAQIRPGAIAGDFIGMPALGGGVGAAAGAGLAHLTEGKKGKGAILGSLAGAFGGSMAGSVRNSARGQEEVYKDMANQNEALRNHLGKEAFELHGELEKIAKSMPGFDKLKDAASSTKKIVSGKGVEEAKDAKKLGQAYKVDDAHQAKLNKDVTKEKAKRGAVIGGGVAASGAAVGGGVAAATKDKEKTAEELHAELEKIALKLPSIQGVKNVVTGKGVKDAENTARIGKSLKFDDANQALLDGKVKSEKTKRGAVIGGGVAAAGLGAGAVGAAGTKAVMDNKQEKVASTFGEEAEKEKKDRPSVDKPSEKEDNKKDPENNIKKEKEDAEKRDHTDVHKNGFTSKEASEDVDFMNALFKESGALVLNETMEKVASHVDPMDRINLGTFGYRKR